MMHTINNRPVTIDRAMMREMIREGIASTSPYLQETRKNGEVALSLAVVNFGGKAEWYLASDNGLYRLISD